MNISKNIKRLRNKKNLSQTDMAKKLNITRQAYNHYETGKRIPPLETLQLISGIFEVSLDYLLGKSDDPTSINEKDRSAGAEQSEDMLKLEKILSELSIEDLKTLADHAEYLASRHKKQNL